MSKKMQVLFGLLIVLSMIFSACGTPAATEAPVVEEPVPTEAIVVEEPALDTEGLFAALIGELPADKGYGTVKPAALMEELADTPPFLLDVREASEVEADGYIEGAVNIPVRELLANLDKLPEKDQPIVVYCASGHRGGMTIATLKLLGYTNVRNLGGGLNGWKKANLPVVTGSTPEAPAALSAPVIEDPMLFDAINGFFVNMPDDFYTVKSDKLAEELTGTAPTIIDVRTADEWNKDGYIAGALNIPFNDFFNNLNQLPADKSARIVVMCASGHRGSIILMAMRMMGYDNVSNLAGGLNAWKTAKMPVTGWIDWPTKWTEYIAAMPEGFSTIKAADLNTALVEDPPFLLDVREAAELGTDGFLTGAVNIPVREVLNNLDKLPAKDQPIVVYCASGHRGAMVMASLQMLGYTDVKNLAGGLNGWKKAELPVETGTLPAAPVAGTAPEVDATLLRDLNNFLANLPEGFYTVKAPDLNVELTGSPAPVLVDVRTAEETANGYIEGALLIPFADIPANLAQLPADKAAPIVVLCQSGHRGAMVMMYLRMIGYTEVRNLAGGMNAWVAAELPVVK
ncbi:MAG TPA: rhodanese-like domain-containing protein [Anaerolineales bacterium]|nr:rhodanese-like domain-containing protein [Anaerolineales bacterium]HNN13134.1 rhodanese-like domain-containing protein [Anaerolineales bacterium]